LDDVSDDLGTAHEQLEALPAGRKQSCLLLICGVSVLAPGL
jgi:hypothetical protein